MTRAGFEYVLEKHVRVAAEISLNSRALRLAAQLRHSCAVIMLQPLAIFERLLSGWATATCARPRFIFVSSIRKT